MFASKAESPKVEEPLGEGVTLPPVDSRPDLTTELIASNLEFLETSMITGDQAQTMVTLRSALSKLMEQMEVAHFQAQIDARVKAQSGSS